LFHGKRNSALGLLEPVTSNKKLQKQKEIAPVHDKGCRIVFRPESTRRLAIAIGFVLFCLVKVKGRAGDSHTHNHLRNLKAGNNHGIEPLRLQAHGCEKVVSVHAGMYRVVHSNKENTRGRLGCIRMPAVEENGNVVIPVQKDEGFLVNDNEKGINEFAVQSMEQEEKCQDVSLEYNAMQDIERRMN
jgi:hypothetical protein